MYSNDFVGVIRAGGQILREAKNKFGETVVRLPFGSEYEIRLKNLKPVKAVVNIIIDDVVVVNNLIIEPSNKVDVKGFVDGLFVTEKFCFVEKFNNKCVDDNYSTVNIFFRFEKEIHYSDSCFFPMYPLCSDLTFVKQKISTILSDEDEYLDLLHSIFLEKENKYNFFNNFGKICKDRADLIKIGGSNKGIKSKDNIDGQEFEYDYTGVLEFNSSLITIKLTGYDESGNKITSAVSTKIKLFCPVCGKKWPSSYKFCPMCAVNLKEKVKEQSCI